MKNQKLILGTVVAIGGLGFYAFYLPYYREKRAEREKAKEEALVKKTTADFVQVTTDKAKIMADLYKDPNYIWGDPIPADVQKKLDEVVVSKEYQDMQDKIKQLMLNDFALSGGKIMGSIPTV